MNSRSIKLIAAFLALAGSLTAMPEADTIESAVAQAKAENKTVLVEFTGRDWCGACKHLRKNILNNKDFDSAVSGSYIMVELDFPRDPNAIAAIGTEERARREALRVKYGVRGYPTVVMMDADGLPFKYIVGSRNTPDDYFRVLSEGQAVRARRDAAFKKAEGLTGMERAKALVEGLSVLGGECREKHGAVLKEVMALDPENTLGYYYVLDSTERRAEQSKELRNMTRDFGRHYSVPQMMKDIAALDEFMARKDMLPDIRQSALYAKSECYSVMHDMENTLKYAKEAYDADPGSSEAVKIKRSIDHLENVVIPRMKAERNQ